MNHQKLSTLEQVYQSHHSRMAWEDEILCRHWIRQAKSGKQIKQETIEGIARILYKYATYEEINNLSNHE